MRKLLTASKDTTLYEAYPTSNAGFDEIIEVGKVVNPSMDYTTTSSGIFASASARILIHFNLPTTESVSANADYYLNLRLARGSEVYRNQEILISQISRSWEEGSGYFYQQPRNVNDGATWQQYVPFSSWSLAGGDIRTGAQSASVTLSTYPMEDLRVNVTNIIRPIVSQSLQNTFYGLMLHFPTADEQNFENKGNIKFFSTQTHTIHQPTLEVAWNDQVFLTGSLQSTPSSLNVKVATSNLQESYARGDVTRVNLVVRDMYPLKSFDSTLRYKNKYYLPSSSYYAITDVQSNTQIIPFDDYSRIHCDSNGPYVVLDTSPLYRGRYFRLKFKISNGTYSKTIDTFTDFKIQ